MTKREYILSIIRTVVQSALPTIAEVQQFSLNAERAASYADEFWAMELSGNEYSYTSTEGRRNSRLFTGALTVYVYVGVKVLDNMAHVDIALAPLIERVEAALQRYELPTTAFDNGERRIILNNMRVLSDTTVILSETMRGVSLITVEIFYSEQLL